MNNRMEILAAIVALGSLKRPCRVTLYSDSQYLMEAIRKGWAQRWRANGWKRNRNPALFGFNELLVISDGVENCPFETVA
jgi:ribonuclease HI